MLAQIKAPLSNHLHSTSTTSHSGHQERFSWIFSFLSVVYVVIAFGCSGVPGVSRIALYVAILLLFSLAINIASLKIPFWAILIIFFYVYLTVPAFAYANTHFDVLGKLVATLIGTLAISLALSNRKISYSIIVYGAMIATVINVLAIHLGIELAQFSSEGRHSGLIGNANSLCINMALTSFLIWIFAERFNWLIRVFGIFIMLYGTYITGSRKGLVFIAALLLIVLMDSIRKLSLLKLIALCLLLFTTGLISYGILTKTIILYGSEIPVIQRTIKTISGQEKSFEDRKMLINKGIMFWKESPFFGHGFYQFANLSRLGTYAHNNYIELAVSGGIIGLLLFYSLHLIILIKSFNQTRTYQLRILIFISLILLIDSMAVTFYDKTVMCTLGTLLGDSYVKSRLADVI